MGRHLNDQDNAELKLILTQLLEDDVDMSIREVTRRHSKLKNASSISRNEARRRMVEDFRSRLAERRAWVGRLRKKSRDKIAFELEAAERRNSELESQNKSLVRGVVGLINAVFEMGGMAKVAEFYEKYRDVRAKLGDHAPPLPSSGSKITPVNFSPPENVQ